MNLVDRQEAIHNTVLSLLDEFLDLECEKVKFRIERGEMVSRVELQTSMPRFPGIHPVYRYQLLRLRGKFGFPSGTSTLKTFPQMQSNLSFINNIKKHINESVERIIDKLNSDRHDLLLIASASGDFPSEVINEIMDEVKTLSTQFSKFDDANSKDALNISAYSPVSLANELNRDPTFAKKPNIIQSPIRMTNLRI